MGLMPMSPKTGSHNCPRIDDLDSTHRFSTPGNRVRGIIRTDS